MKISCSKILALLILGGILYFSSSVYCFAFPQPKVWNLSDENLFFVGREEQLTAMNSFFERDDRRILALTGGPGFGKSQIAKKFAQKFSHNYDLIWWFDSKQDISSQFEKLATALNAILSEKDKINPSILSKPALIEAVKNILRIKPIKYLFIFDNAEEYSQIESFIPYAHLKFRKNVLFTSRNSNIWPDKVEIGKLKRQDSLHLIRTALPLEKAKDMHNLADVLNDYPLGLTIAVGFIKSNLTTSISKYIDVHLKKTLSQKGKRSSPLLDSYSKDAQTTLSISLKAIEDDSKDALEILFFMSLLNSKDIPESYIESWLKKTNSSLTADEAITYVYDQSLVDIRKEYKKDGYSNKDEAHLTHYLSVHDLIHQLINEKLTEQEKKKLLDIATEVMLEVFAGRSFDFIKKVTKEPVHLLHAQKLYENAQKIGYTSSQLLKLKVCILEFVAPAMRDFQTAMLVLEDIEKDLKLGLKLEPYYEALFKINKGFYESIYNVNYDEAIRNMSEASDILAPFKQYSEERLRALSNLAQYYALRGVINKADEFISQGKAIFEKSKNELCNNFFISTWSFILSDQGKFEEALDVIQKAKATPQFIADYATLYHSLLHHKIEILLKQQRIEEAQQTLEEYETRIKKFYQERYKTYLGFGSILYYKSLIFLYKGMPAYKSIKLLSEAIKFYNKILSGNKKHKHQARTHLALGKAHALNKDYTEALKSYLFCEEIYDVILKEKKTDDVSDLYAELAILGAHLKDEGLTQKYLTVHIEAFGLDHPRTEKILKVLDGVSFVVLKQHS